MAMRSTTIMTGLFPRHRSRLITFAALCVAVSACWASPVLMISIDGLKPEYLTQADAHGLRIPTLRRFVQEGAYADGVIASLPTVTYPNHTTLITGVWPPEHGILNNQLFDPEHKLAGALYWYAESIKVPTVAAILGVNLPSAKQPKLPIAP
jgi:predicted AlkP superfamily pyrophosphatase or phosphodiesterase